MQWREYAACRDIGLEAFFDEGKGMGNSIETRMAKKVCEGCPVRRQCLDTALKYEQRQNKSERAGIWGGLTANQRYLLWQQMLKLHEVELCVSRLHRMDEDNVYVDPKTGYRNCRACKTETRRKWEKENRRAS